MVKERKESKIVVYQTKNGALELRGDVKNETIWADQAQIVKLFDIDQSVISRHIKNIFKDGEIDQKNKEQMVALVTQLLTSK